jgi:uncharacterized membrane protein
MKNRLLLFAALWIALGLVVLAWAITAPMAAGWRSVGRFLFQLVVLAGLSGSLITLGWREAPKRWRRVLYVWGMLAWFALNAVASSVNDSEREFMEFIDLFVVGGVVTGFSGLFCIMAYSARGETKKGPNQAAQTTPGLRPSVSDL